LEGTDELSYTDAQYRQLNALLGCLRAHYPAIENDAICGHSEIAPGRKTDPGPSFDWARIARETPY
jgi:AmpD protein